MEIFKLTLNQMLLMFGFNLIGFFLRKKKILPENAGTVLSRMETFVFVPALTFYNQMNKCTVETFLANKELILYGAALVLISVGVAYPLSALLIRKAKGDRAKEYLRNIYRYALTFGNYTVRAYRANHSTVNHAVHFIISNGERTLFYGLDGAWLLYEEVQAIKEYRPDLAILDATIGEKEGDHRIFEHNNLRMVREIQMTLKPYIKQFCIDHMARTLHTDHQSLEENMKAYGIMVAYDGLEVEI